jgi:hypothetical protein
VPAVPAPAVPAAPPVPAVPAVPPAPAAPAVPTVPAAPMVPAVPPIVPAVLPPVPGAPEPPPDPEAEPPVAPEEGSSEPVSLPVEAQAVNERAAIPNTRDRAAEHESRRFGRFVMKPSEELKPDTPPLRFAIIVRLQIPRSRACRASLLGYEKRRRLQRGRVRPPGPTSTRARFGARGAFLSPPGMRLFPLDSWLGSYTRDHLPGSPIFQGLQV